MSFRNCAYTSSSVSGFAPLGYPIIVYVQPIFSRYARSPPKAPIPIFPAASSRTSSHMRLACSAFAPFAETVQEVKPCLMACRMSSRMPSSSRLLKSGVKEGRIKLPKPFRCSCAHSFFSDWAERETSAALLTGARTVPPIAPRPRLRENCLRFICVTPNQSRIKIERPPPPQQTQMNQGSARAQDGVESVQRFAIAGGVEADHNSGRGKAMRTKVRSRRSFLVDSAAGLNAAWVAANLPGILAAQEHARQAAESGKLPRLEVFSEAQAEEI